MAAVQLTADRRQSTGEGHQALVPLLTGSGEGLSIPAARDAEQARLEAEVLRRVCSMGGLSRHPLGIVRVRPQEDALSLQLVDEPVIIGHWVEFLYPRVSDVKDAGEDPRDRVGGVPGLRSARMPGGVRLYRPGLGAAVLLRGFSPGRWERIAAKREGAYGSLLRRPGWTPVEKAAYDAPATEPFGALSALLPRIRAGQQHRRLDQRQGPAAGDDGRTALPRPHLAPVTEALRTGVGGHRQDVHLPVRSPLHRDRMHRQLP
ncbi:hypothetical protein OHA57_00360 [Streptomyces anulatus]|uniref:hypothetical protein n=1 Tax=Streptomyces anulatus TaxID=1892 RepID=UPI002DD967D2|nr:hypothetical protein [Streptomyces anulatus]WSC59275.1 hypothetical protein OHA57_00360 [Streptomyces anulatus]WSU94260.1 hypothetical protein OG575_38900 [Streptomyces anulatus]